ncbi:TnsA endonuclease N-terminal domain-containing protein [Pseudoalteromonas sp. MMG024]|uniref:TnsA endonuclease N-terminal domain-containing protein n=1 Tax=Pseudoalteromonas sp. MMG024 TaxID=2909980 RepID=UPI001F3A5B6D|nr:TnsA endonuclease N-terminal domain-containing protein [Pseudoalteromonas sp. MMG024]MCF6459220.1 TnsA endonuclease N-terminal domain-containing protein [Pseudoalteromonas sp. MMG024]
MARRKLETFEDFNRALKNKYGIGEENHYKPWLRVQDVKSKGVRSQILGLKTGRVHHTLSAIETDFFYLAEYSDSVIDIREQFPLLPINLSIKIAEVLGIEHPTHPKTKEPIIITTDFLLTRSIGEQVVYEAISVKPEGESGGRRVLEKLEIERVWWELLGIKFSYYVGSELTKIQSRNINWATHPLRSETEVFTEYEMDFATSFLTLGNHFIRDICDQFVNEMGMKHEMALTMLRSLIGSKRVNVDLSSSLESADFINISNIRNVEKDLVNGAC